MNDNVFVLILCLNEICTPGIMFRRCDESHRRKAKGLLGKETINTRCEKMDNKKVILMLRRAPLESTTPLKKSSKSCKS